PLGYVDYEDFSMHQIDDAETVVSALRTTLDVDELRVLASVPDPMDFGPEANAAQSVNSAEGEEPTEPTRQPVAAPLVPPANLCPMSEASPSYTEAMNDPESPEYRAAMADWRCQNSYLNISGGIGGHLMV